MKKQDKNKSKKKKSTKKKNKDNIFTRINNWFKRLERRIFNDKEDLSNSSFSLLEVIIIILISILFGIIIGYLITFSKGGVASDSNIEEIVDTYHNIVDEYYGKVDKDKLSEAAIKGMIDSLEDPYSNYMDNETTNDFNEQIDGSFVGIGVVVMYGEDEYNHIVEIYKNSPAEKAGLKANDIIIRVDGEDTKGVYGNDIASRIRGEEGSNVHVSVLREDEELEFDVTRGTIEIKSVSSKVFDGDKKIGYLRIENFAANTYSQFVKELKSLEKKKIDSLIIDVRSNPGGHLLQTRQILSLFFDKKTVLYQIQTKRTKKKVYSYTNDKRDYPIAILTDSGSASASEILASCFKDNYKKATIIGTKTYGKGTVQKSQSLSSGTSIKYTTEKWLTPKGKWINKKGVKPDIEVKLTEEYANDPSDETDAQLQKALEVLKESK